MVHALEEIKRLLKPDGFLIDIHPVREEPLIQIHQGRKLLYSTSDPGYDYDENLQHAEEALEDVIERGLFLVEAHTEFDVVTHASSVSELRDYWARYGAYDAEPKDETMLRRQDQVYAQANEIMQKASTAKLMYHERARIMRLEPVTIA